jgi:hypothetical protein
VLLPEDGWVGDAVSSARIAYETWTGLLRGEIKIQPEGSLVHRITSKGCSESSRADGSLTIFWLLHWCGC